MNVEFGRPSRVKGEALNWDTPSQAHDPQVGADWEPSTRSGKLETHPTQEDTMSKTGRKRRARKKKNANHGKRPNA